MTEYIRTHYFADFLCPCCDSRRVIVRDIVTGRTWRCHDCTLEGAWNDAGQPVIVWPLDQNSTDTQK